MPDPVDPNCFPLISYRSPFEKKKQEIKVTCMLVSYYFIRELAHSIDVSQWKAVRFTTAYDVLFGSPGKAAFWLQFVLRSKRKAKNN